MIPVALTLSHAVDAAQIGLVIVALLALGGAIWQSLLARRSAREALTYNYFPRFAAAEIGRSLDKLQQIMGDDDGERWACFVGLSFTERFEVLVAPNLCEELGGVYKHGMVEGDVVKTAFGHTAAILWREFDWFVNHMRRGGDIDVYKDWEAMLIDMGFLSVSRAE